VLLVLEAENIHRQLARHFDLRKEDKTPAAHLRAVRKIEILGERVAVPSAGIENGAAPEHTAVPLKLKKRPE
jgi:hypothetical protein